MSIHLRPAANENLDLLQGKTDEEACFCPAKPLIQSARQTLGLIDLLPVGSRHLQRQIDAAQWYPASAAHQALATPWSGRTYLTPHPVSKYNRLLIRKLIVDYLSSRVRSAVLHLHRYEIFRQEPILLSFPICFHYIRRTYSVLEKTSNPSKPKLKTFASTYPSIDIYLPQRNHDTIDEEALQRFLAAFKPHGRIILSEAIDPDWETDAYLATGQCKPPPLLISRGLDRHNTGRSRQASAST